MRNRWKVYCIFHENPLLNTSVYKLEYKNSSIESYFANQIAKFLFASVDKKRQTVVELQEIVDYQYDCSWVHPDDRFI